MTKKKQLLTAGSQEKYLLPEHLSLNKQQFLSNLDILRQQTVIDVGRFEVIDTYKKEGAAYMLEDLKGATFVKNTEIRLISSGQKGVFATCEIPAGTILGGYFGEKLRDEEEVSALAPDKAQLIKACPVFDESGQEEVDKFFVVGKLPSSNNKNSAALQQQTKQATMNHAPQKKNLLGLYRISKEAIDLVATANIISVKLKVTLNDEDVTLAFFVAVTAIKPGQQLLWEYFLPKVDFYSRLPYQFSPHFQIKLFAKDNQFLCEEDYLPRVFTLCLKGAEEVIAIPYYLIPFFKENKPHALLVGFLQTGVQRLSNNQKQSLIASGHMSEEELLSDEHKKIENRFADLKKALHVAGALSDAHIELVKHFMQQEIAQDKTNACKALFLGGAILFMAAMLLYREQNLSQSKSAGAAFFLRLLLPMVLSLCGIFLLKVGMTSNNEYGPNDQHLRALRM